MSSPRILPVPEGLVGERIDVGLSRMLGLSRSQCASLVEEGRVLVDGEVPSKSLRLPMGVLLEVDLPTPDTTPPPTASLDILYEDEDLIVINKPV